MKQPQHAGLAMPHNVTACHDRPVLDPCTLESCDYEVDPYLGCGHLGEYCYVIGEAETDWSREILMHSDLADRLGEALVRAGVLSAAAGLGHGGRAQLIRSPVFPG